MIQHALRCYLRFLTGAAIVRPNCRWPQGSTAQTASWHLAKLADGQLITVEKRGRNRYFRLASPVVAQALEAVMAIAITGSRPSRSHALTAREQALAGCTDLLRSLCGKIGPADRSVHEAKTDRSVERRRRHHPARSKAVWRLRHEPLRYATIEASVLPIVSRLE